MQLTNEIRGNLHERTPYNGCPLCDDRDSSVEHRADARKHALWRPCFEPEMVWLRCSKCRHGYTSGYYEGAALAELLDKIQKDRAPGVDFERHRMLAAPIVERCLSLIGHEPKGEFHAWLDVCCGNGALVATAEEFGFGAVGIDLRPYVVEALKTVGIGAECKALADVELCEEFFSVISLADVLEHVPYPHELLTQAHERTAPNGLLFVSCPVADSPAWRMLGEQNPYWWELEHFHNFSRQTLYKLLRDAGFEPIHYTVSQRYRVGMEVIARKVTP